MADKMFFDEEKLEQVYKQNYTRFQHEFNLNTFLQWCWEWEETCNKIKRIAKMKKGVRYE